MADPVTIALVVGAVGTAVSAAGTIASGQAAAKVGAAQQAQLQQKAIAEKRAAEFEAAQLYQQGKEEQAAAQRTAQQYERSKKLALSKLTAQSAAGGFTATDPTTLALASDIEEYGTYQQQLAMYGGAAKRNELELAAAGRRYSGEQALRYYWSEGDIARAKGSAARTASYFDAGSTILGGISSFGTKYAKLKPPSSSSYYSNPTRLGTLY